MALVCVCSKAPDGKRFIATSSATKVTIVAEENDRETQGQDVGVVTLNAAQTPAVGGESVVAMTASRQGQLLAVVTSEKRLVVWEESGEWRVRGERSVAKRVTSLQISEDEQYLLTADKTGTVTRYRLSDISCDGEEMMGHLSMILDMVMVSHDSHVITCDRDEKIRVSRYPNCYNIETYCLGHTEFVSCLCLCEKWPHLLVSASGDGTVRSWEWRNGRLLDTHHFSEDGQDPVTVTQVVCSRNMEQPLIVATVEGSSELVVLQLSSDGRFKRSPAIVTLSVSPWSCAFDWSDRLWVCLPHQQDPVQCWQFEGGKCQRCSSPLQEKLSNWDTFRECGEGMEWCSLRKTTIDNMTQYLARKEERMSHQRGSANKLPTSDTRADEKSPQPPPEKKMKTQTVT